MVFVGIILIIVMLAVLPLLTPWFVHVALDAAGSAAVLGVAADQAHALSDRSVEELVVGPGDFDLVGPDGTPFYDDAERGHLQDARTLLWLLLIAGGLAIMLIGAIYSRAAPSARPAVWRTISRAGLVTAGTVVVLGSLSLVAFGAVFSVFHQIFFPAGNFSFDPATQRLVQLYPFRFWQITAAVFAVLLFLLAVGGWWLGRRGARRGVRPDHP